MPKGAPPVDGRSPVERVLAALQAHGAEPREDRGGGWLALCPVHGDRHPSLKLDAGDDGRALLVCRSHRCAAEDVMEAVGLRLADLYPSGTSNGNGATPRERQSKVRPTLSDATVRSLSEAREALRNRPDAIEWLRVNRAISPEASARFLGLDSDQRVIVIAHDGCARPYAYVRWTPPASRADGAPHVLADRGAKRWPMWFFDLKRDYTDPERQTVIVAEGEMDGWPRGRQAFRRLHRPVPVRGVRSTPTSLQRLACVALP